MICNEDFARQLPTSALADFKEQYEGKQLCDDQLASNDLLYQTVCRELRRRGKEQSGYTWSGRLPFAVEGDGDRDSNIEH